MIFFLKFFLILIYFYQILNTFFIYGLFNGEHQIFFTIFRDFLRFLFFLLLILLNLKIFFKHIKKYRIYYLIFFLLSIRGFFISYTNGVPFTNAIIGFKYNIYFLFILLSSIFIGNLLFHKGYKIEIFMSFFIKTIVVSVILGFLRQVLKFIFPDFFYLIGFGKIGDFEVGQNPPIYYLTGHNGIPRLSGLFSGPNNYGYFLVVFFSLFIYCFSQKNYKNIYVKYLTYFFYLISILFTFSRGAFIGVFIQIYLLLKSFKFFSKKVFFYGSIVLILLISTFSFIKGASTFLHFENSSKAMNMMFLKPLGYGLGTSGPSSHYTFSQGPSIIPENLYLQIIIDIGVIGFLLRIAFLILIFLKTINLKSRYDNIYLKLLSFGFIAILFEGFFLHVLEDSMVNYLFFVIFGIMIGYVDSPPKEKKVEI